MVPETGIEPVRPLFTKRRILCPMCLPISPLGIGGNLLVASGCPGVFDVLHEGVCQCHIDLFGGMSAGGICTYRQKYRFFGGMS